MSLSYSHNVTDVPAFIDCILSEIADGYENELSVFEPLDRRWGGHPGITDGKGTVFVDPHGLTAYGANNQHQDILKRLDEYYGVRARFIW